MRPRGLIINHLPQAQLSKLGTHLLNDLATSEGWTAGSIVLLSETIFKDFQQAD